MALSAVAAAVAASRIGRLPQSAAYHGLADRRTLLGVPNAADVLSNLPFVVVGALGLQWLRRAERCRAAFADGRERAAWLVFFGSILLVGLGSAFYHLQPDNARLVWDRLPLAVACMALLDAVIGERVGPRVGRALLLPLVALALLSVGWWAQTEAQGAGDLRLYGFVQYYTPLGIALLLLLLPARHAHSGHYWMLLLWYAVAKLCENFDHPVFDATGLVSGHTLKHLCAAAGTLHVLVMLRQRAGAQSRTCESASSR